MTTRADIEWFKRQFGTRIEAATAGTPFRLDLLVALACQETGFIWASLRRKGFDEARILALCVGDVIDASGGRRAFPVDKAALLAVADGQKMFDIARQALLDMSQHIGGYAGAANNQAKFCRGFGLFQRDLQFFKTDPQYFLQRRYAQFDATLDHALRELKSMQQRIGLGGRSQLDVLELTAVAIAYNTGKYVPSRGLKQGFRSSDGRYYGEAIFDYLRLSETVESPGEAVPLIPPAGPGQAIVPPPSPVIAQGPLLRVDTRVSTLLLRSEPRKSDPSRANVVGELPDGQLVRALTGVPVSGYMAVETSLAGALLRGFASTDYLVPEPDATEVPVLVPNEVPPLAEGLGAVERAAGVPPVWMPHRDGQIVRRTQAAGAHSLNEPGQPARRGADAAALRAELGAIIDWLDVEKAAHLRYQPRAGLTFCNIYAHDYCHLAGVYLARVWWSSQALLEMARGREVAPLIGNTIHEMRANDLFHWLRDFGPAFGWRQTGTLTKLQIAANQGAVALIVARRKQVDRSGHIVAVVPETDKHRARRDAAGGVISPLQSQAGARNSRYGTAQAGWWNSDAFAEYAFWIHA